MAEHRSERLEIVGSSPTSLTNTCRPFSDLRDKRRFLFDDGSTPSQATGLSV